MSTVIEPPLVQIEKNLEELETVTIRFAGDSGDGMQLTGTQFTNTSAVSSIHASAATPSITALAR